MHAKTVLLEGFLVINL